jgi:hypothetical protein
MADDSMEMEGEGPGALGARAPFKGLGVSKAQVRSAPRRRTSHRHLPALSLAPAGTFPLSASPPPSHSS